MMSSSVILSPPKHRDASIIIRVGPRNLAIENGVNIELIKLYIIDEINEDTEINTSITINLEDSTLRNQYVFRIFTLERNINKKVNAKACELITDWIQHYPGLKCDFWNVSDYDENVPLDESESESD